jgi:hypothetical protein
MGAEVGAEQWASSPAARGSGGVARVRRAARRAKSTRGRATEPALRRRPCVCRPARLLVVGMPDRASAVRGVVQVDPRASPSSHADSPPRPAVSALSACALTK